MVSVDPIAGVGIVRLYADDRVYYPASMPKEDWMGTNWVPHTEMEVPLGSSRYGGPLMDLPVDFTPPVGMRFAAQLDLGYLSRFDGTGLMPKRGQLLVYADIVKDRVQVSYHDVPNDTLIRHVDEHEDHFFSGILIKEGSVDSESIEERFRPKNEWDPKEAPDRLWDEFAGSDKSKVWGIPTNCQLEQGDIQDIMASDKLVLLQVGEDGFNDEGVFSVLIPKVDLERMEFGGCECMLGQS